MLQNLTKENWSPHLNQEFRVGTADTEPLSMTLVEVTGLSDKPGQARQPFSIVLSGPGDIVLNQAIYTVQHQALGDLDIFLVPLGPKGEHMLYEAVFT